MEINEKALENDSVEENLALVPRYKMYILEELFTGRGWVTMTELYKGDYYDIPLYLAVHELIVEGTVEGISPYDEESPDNHGDMVFSLAEVTCRVCGLCGRPLDKSDHNACYYTDCPWGVEEEYHDESEMAQAWEDWLPGSGEPSPDMGSYWECRSGAAMLSSLDGGYVERDAEVIGDDEFPF
jgi:hypothetical protein